MVCANAFTYSQYKGNPPYPLALVKLTWKASDNNLTLAKTPQLLYFIPAINGLAEDSRILQRDPKVITQVGEDGDEDIRPECQFRSDGRVNPSPHGGEEEDEDLHESKT